MRIAFVHALTEQAKKDSRIMLLTGDLGFSVFEEYIKRFPKQYINAGVAEQNMTGVAAGLAMEGKIPIIYSIVPFVTMRNFEQIRNDICYQNLNVKIIGIGAGFSYGPYGHTHHGLEDMGILRTIPRMIILAPGDPLEVELATNAAILHTGPVYLRLGKKGEPNVHNIRPRFTIGKGIIITKGSDVTIIASSTMLHRGLEVSEALKKHNISVRLVSMHTIKPIDEEMIVTCVKETKAVVTLEEHSIIGGLGSAVAEVIAERSSGVPFKRIGVSDRFTESMGMQEYMREKNGLSVDQITAAVLHILNRE